LGLGNSYYNDNKFADSIAPYKKAAELSPTWLSARLYLGDAYLKTSQNRLALDTFKAAVGIDAKSPEANYGMGLAYVAMNNSAMAKVQYDKLVTLDKGMADKLLAKIPPQP